MSRLLVIAVIVVSALLVWKSGALNGVLGGGSPAPGGQDPSAALIQAHDTMTKLHSVHITVMGTSAFNDMGEVPVTGNGDLYPPHKANLNFQFLVPGKGPLPLNERIEGGHVYVQNPSQGPSWKDVTGNPTSQLLPELDPLNNLDFLKAARASDDMGNMTMDNLQVQHFSVKVDPSSYVDQLKADALSGIGPADDTALSGAAIQVEAWVSPIDHYIHQMHIEMTARQFSWDVTYRFSNFVTGGSTSA
jgi:hypothetical protein